MTGQKIPFIAMAMTCLLVCGLPFGRSHALAQSGSDTPLHQAERATVRVVSLFYDTDQQIVGAATGSGFVVAPGNVVTNRHVVSYDGAAYATVYVIPHRDSGERGVPAKIVDTWEDGDLALLRSPDLLAPPLTLAAVMPDKDATVHALGYPGVTDAIRDLSVEEVLKPAEAYVTPGSIALFSTIAPGGRRLDTIFHTAAVNPGNSGGPLVDACGHVIGVNTWTAGSTISSEGISVPAGQFIATKSTNLIRFLTSLGLTPTVDNDACVPLVAVNPEIENRLKAAESALAAEQASLNAERQAAKESKSALMRFVGWSFAIAALVGLLVIAIWGPGRPFIRGLSAKLRADPESSEVKGNTEAHPQTSPSTLPIALIIPVVLGFGIVTYLIASVSLRAKATPAQPPLSTNHFLNCALSAPETRNPAPGAGSLVFTFDQSRQCVNERTAYEAVNGRFVRVMLQTKGRVLSRLELSPDFTRFVRQDFNLDKSAFDELNAARKRENPLTCGLGPQVDPATSGALTRLRSASEPFMSRAPDALMTWHCKVQDISPVEQGAK